MDFSYVHGGRDPFVKTAARFMRLRASAGGVVPSNLPHLQAVLDKVDGSVPPGESVDTLFLVSHASPVDISIPLVAGQRGPTSYERLAEQLLQPPPSQKFRAPIGQPVDYRIRGCRIGRDESYVRLLKHLLGGVRPVSAPRHYNYFVEFRDRRSKTLIEHLGYDLEIHARNPVKTLPGLIGAFTAAGFTKYDGSSLTAEITAALDQFLGPKNGGLKRLKPAQFLPDERSTTELRVPLKATITFREAVAGRPKHVVTHMSRYEAARVEMEVARIDQAALNANPVAHHVAKARAAWEARFKSITVNGATVTRTFAEHLGLHPHESPDMVTWEARPASGGHRIVAIYYRYELDLPVTSTTDGTLLFDSRTERGAPLSVPKTWPADGAHLARLFRVV